MSSITPKSVCESIGQLLSKSGHLKGEGEAVKLLENMKESSKLFQKAIYLNVLKHTISDKVLTAYLNQGGWDLLNAWLTEAKKSGNISLAIEILEVLRHLPVTLALLKQGNMGKVVKSFSKLDNKDVKKISSDILEDWMKVVKENPTGKKKARDREEESVSKKDQLLPKKSLHKTKPLAESAGFLDAITTTKVAAPKKIRKRSSTEGERKSVSELDRTPTTPQDLTPSIPNIPKPKPKPAKVPANERPSAPIIRALLSNSPPPLPEKSHGNDNMFCFRRAKKRRRIRWRDTLEDVQFFECDESERANNKSFADSMIKEYEKERLAVLRSRQLGDDVMVEMVPWKHPLKLDGAAAGVERGAASKEREVQREREKSVLAVLIFDHNATPETPHEPDQEELLYNYIAPKTIPLHDPNEHRQQQPPPSIGHEVTPPPIPSQPQIPQQQQQQQHNALPPVLSNIIPNTPAMQQVPEQQMQYEPYNVQRYPQYNSQQPPQHNRNGGGGGGGSGWYQNNRHSYNEFYDRRHYRKTKPCAFFNTAQGCRSGDKCNFLHDVNSGNTPMPGSRRWEGRSDGYNRNRGYHHHHRHAEQAENIDSNGGGHPNDAKEKPSDTDNT